MNSRSVRFILFVQETPGQTVSDLAQYFKVSKRTIFSWIFLANSSLEGSAIIHAVKGKYEVRVIDAERFSKLTNSFVDKYGISDSSRKRISDLLHNLLIRTDWITIDSLSQIFYVSRVSISNDLKKVEQILAPYKLSLLRRPRYGIRIDGSEINRRICLASLIQKGLNSEKVVEDDFVSVQEISEIIEEILKEEKFQLSLIGYQNLLVHLAIALSRIKKDCYVPIEPKYLATIENSKEYRVSQCIAKNIQQSYGIELPKEEIAYIAIHLAGKQIVSEFAEENESSLVVTDEIWNIVNQIVEHISNVYKFDFTDDIELRMNLARHIAPLLVRLQYQMHAENPLLLDIKTRFPLAFSMAQETVGILMGISGTQPSEDEIGYLALSFALALERKKVDVPKKNILIVCATGSGSARLLEYKYRAQFANQIGTIRTCDVLQVSLQDFTNIDYVFTTVPLKVSVPVPVRVVSNFLNDEDIKVINRIFNKSDKVVQVFKPSLFFPHRKFLSKEELLKFMCNAIGRKYKVSEEFYESVMLRESLAPTAFGNMVAMPHPMISNIDETFVSVCLLDELIIWDEKEVRAVFLVSPARKKDINLHTFYQAFLGVLMNQESVKALLEDQRLDVLINFVKDQ